MEELIHKLGIDWKILIAQMINFGLVVFVLWKFAYKPIIAMLEQRTAKIEGGVKNAERVEQELKDIMVRRDEELKKARQESQAIVEQARRDGEGLRAELRQAAETEAQKILTQTRQSMAAEKDQMMQEAKGELAVMVKMAAEKVLSEKLDDASDAKLIQAAVTAVKKESA
jgi:F-type H+-transporting ATPase subunit b